MRSQEAHDDDDVVNYGLSEILALSKIKVSSARPDQAAELAVTPLLGMRVAINGLVAKPELNGRTGTAVRFDDDEGRYWVELDDTSSSCMIKPCNLLPAGCTPSTLGVPVVSTQKKEKLGEQEVSVPVDSAMRAGLFKTAAHVIGAPARKSISLQNVLLSKYNRILESLDAIVEAHLPCRSADEVKVPALRAETKGVMGLVNKISTRGSSRARAKFRNASTALKRSLTTTRACIIEKAKRAARFSSMRIKPCTSILTKLVLGGGLEGAACCGVRGLVSK
jgi:hypothetical protein